jgi:hypothetical protein
MIRSEICPVLLFGKAPVAGRVKTRLIPSLGAPGAAALYGRMLSRCLQTALQSGVGPVELWCTPSVRHAFFRRFEMEMGVTLRKQPEGDLGRRMAFALGRTLETSRHALLQGTDCPSVTGADLREASSALKEGAEAVLIPSKDGGYVLIGLSRFAPELFSKIPWGTEAVLEETRIRFKSLGWRWHELGQRWDVDTVEDLEQLRNDGFHEILEGGF